MIAFLFELLLVICVVAGICWLLFRIVDKQEKEKEVIVPVDPIDKALTEAEVRLNEMVELRRKLLSDTRAEEEILEERRSNVKKWTRLYVTMDNLQALEKRGSAERDFAVQEEKVLRLAQQEDDLVLKIAEYRRLIDRAKSDKGYLQSSLTINKFNAELGEIFNENGEAMGALNKLREEVQVTGFEAKLARGEEITFGKETQR